MKDGWIREVGWVNVGATWWESDKLPCINGVDLILGNPGLLSNQLELTKGAVSRYGKPA